MVFHSNHSGLLEPEQGDFFLCPCLRSSRHGEPCSTRFSGKPKGDESKKSNGAKQKPVKKGVSKRKEKIEICGYIYTPELNDVKAFDIQSKFQWDLIFAFGLGLGVRRNF